MQPTFDTLGSVRGAIGGVLLLLMAAYGLGFLLTGRLARLQLGPTIALQLAVGLNLVGWLGFSFGSAGWLGDSRSIYLLMGGAALGGFAIWKDRDKVFGVRRPKSIWLALAAVVGGVVTLGPALCYPTGWDELVYHHELPRRWLADRWPAFYRDLPYSGFPSLGEALFWLVAPIENVISPRLVVWACWASGLVLTHFVFRMRLARGAAATLTAAFGLSGAVLMVSANCYVESILLMNAAAMLFCLESSALRKLRPWRRAAIAGVLAGGAGAVKLTGLAIAVLPCFWYAATLWLSPKQRRQALSEFGMFGFVSTLFLLPFYLRPWLLTGNPFYPYSAGWFSADAAQLDMSRYHHALGSAFGIHNAIGFFAGPLLLAYDFELYDGVFGWQLLALVALAGFALAGFRRRQTRRFIVLPAAATAWLYLFWFLTAQQARFAIPAVLSLCLVAAVGLRTFRGNQRMALLAALLVVTVVSLPWRNTGHYFGSWMTALGVIHSRDYVNESTDKVYLPLVEALETHTPPEAKIMVLFEHRLFYLPRRAVIGTPFFQEAGFTPPEQYEQPEKLMQRLADDGITHVVITNAPAGPDQVPGWIERMEKFLPCFGQCERQGTLKIIWQSERYVLLAVQQEK
jgi:hypothetical protein